jgi:hypothetical protein
MTAPIRRLNARGRAAFREWLDAGATDAPPLALLDDPGASAPLHPSIPRPTKIYDRRYDLGVDLVDLLDDLQLAELQVDTGLWDWFSLYLIDQICPPDDARRRKPGQIDRYLLQLDNHRTRYRHLVRTAWSLARVHGGAARFILAGPLHVHGEAAEQLGAYQDVITCKPLIAAIAFLAWDGDRARLKRGFGGSGAGSARRVPVVAKQFRLTYDLDSMRSEQILALLPREFDRFRDRTARPDRRPVLTVRRDRRDPRLETDSIS